MNILMKNELSKATKDFLWTFVRKDISADNLRQWIYDNPSAMDIVSKETYYELLNVDYNDSEQIEKLRLAITKLLTSYPLECFCCMLPSKMRFYSSCDEHLDDFLKEYYKDYGLKEITSSIVQGFSTSPPAPSDPDHPEYAQYYDPSIFYCQQCDQYWFVIADIDDTHYYVRLTQAEKETVQADLASDLHPFRLPKRLQDWQAFEKLGFFPEWIDHYLDDHGNEIFELIHLAGGSIHKHWTQSKNQCS